MVIPDRSGHSIRWQVNRRVVYIAALIALFFATVVAALVIHYTYIVGQEFKARKLTAENVVLKSQLTTFSQKLDVIESRLADIDRFDGKLEK